MTDQERARQIVAGWACLKVDRAIATWTCDASRICSRCVVLADEIAQALSEARGDAREAPQTAGDIAKSCNCTVHLHCPRCRGADGVTELGADRLTCLDCGHEWPPSALDPIPGEGSAQT